ncbi:MAG: hypothetical protein GY854_31390 [Deltaproteobacteria bacterium]|nr:hypothetical protein [Deltaproteobacteria bacterium]
MSEKIDTIRRQDRFQQKKPQKKEATMQRLSFKLSALVGVIGFVCLGCDSESCDCSRLAADGGEGECIEVTDRDAGTNTDIYIDTESDTDDIDVDTDTDTETDSSDADLPDKGIPFELSNVEIDSPSSQVIGDVIFSESSCAHYAKIDTDSCSVKCIDIDEAACAIATQSDGTEVAVLFARAFSIDEDIQVNIEGQRPLVVIASAEVNIRGGLIALDTIINKNGHAGGYSGNRVAGSDGNGPGGGGGSYGNGGAGGGGYCGAGGAGGQESEGAQPHGESGAANGTVEIVPLKGGSAGGTHAFGEGGAGGGAVQIVSGMSIAVHPLGIISMPGNGGSANSGGGGGSGGTILLEAPKIEIVGVLAANGGGGGAGCGSPSCEGIHGQPDDSAAPGGISTKSANGGNGSAGDSVNGAPGESHTQNDDDTGGGGGAAGRIRINTSDGTADITGTISPSISTGCASIGTLHEN